MTAVPRATALGVALLSFGALAAGGCGGGTTETVTVAGPTVTVPAESAEPVTVTVEGAVTETQTVTVVETLAAQTPLPTTEDGETEPAVSADDGAAQSATTSGRLKQRVSDNGQFSYVVTKFTRRDRLAGLFGDPVTPAAGATFIVVNVRSRNDGDESATPFCGASSAKIEDQKGRVFDVDGDSTIDANSGGDDGFCDDIQPGFTVLTRLVFQVPKGTEPIAVRIADDTDKDDFLGESYARVELKK